MMTAMPTDDPHGRAVPITDPTGFPWAIIAKLPDQDGAELHAGITPGTREAWRARTEELRASGRYQWVRWVTMGFMDEETGVPGLFPGSC